MPSQSHTHAQNHQKHFFPVYLVAFAIIFKNNNRRNMQENPARQRQEIRLPFRFKVFPSNNPRGEAPAKNAMVIPAISMFLFSHKRKAPSTKEIGRLCTKIPSKYGESKCIPANGIPSINAWMNMPTSSPTGKILHFS